MGSSAHGFPLLPRQENSREPKQSRWLNFAEIRTQFDENMQNIRQKSALVDDLMNQGKQEDAEDILRSQVVFAFSALDYFIHELAVHCIACIYDDRWKGEKTESYLNTEITLKELEDARQAMTENADSSAWLREKMKRRYESRTFMKAEEIEKILKTLDLNVSSVLTPQLRASIKNAYERRCKIVHNSDRNTDTKERVPLYQKDADKIMKAISQLADRITSEIQAKEQA